MDGFVDYYRLLRVRYDCDSETIKSAYRELCKQYHPDISKEHDAERRMAELNMAWSVLRNTDSRDKYTQLWKQHNTVSSGAAYVPAVAANAIDPARRALTRYFSYLMQGQYDDAYALLSGADRRKSGAGGFKMWQQSVARLYQLQGFRIGASKTFSSVELDGVGMCEARRFRVAVTERNLITNVVSEYEHIKFAALEADGWRIYLGYADLSSLAKDMREDDAAGAEVGTRLVKRAAFYEHATREAYRHTRYHRPFGVGILRFFCAEPAFEEKIPPLVGHMLARALRITDVMGQISRSCFAVLLGETEPETARRVVERLGSKLCQVAHLHFDARVEFRVDMLDYESGDIAAMLDALLAKKVRRRA